jgi:NAD(P)-dependent dehydrogenase (short-subunit alcohol dehydrogenase family)
MTGPPERNVVVTGAGGGIGRATCIAFAEHGYRVTVADLDEEAGQGTVDSVRSIGGEAVLVRVDVTRAADVAAMVEHALASFGPVHAAVNAAGIVGPSGVVALHEYTEDVWQQVIGVNLTAMWLSLKYEIGAMLGSGGGAILNIASTAGLTGSVGRVAYSTSKHGVIGLTRCAAKEYGGNGIRVNALCPGGTMTPLLRSALAADPPLLDRLSSQTPANRLATPEEVGAAAVWMCSADASYFNGAVVPMDGGMTA